jgi:Uma2 family endonuclease
MLDDMRVLMLQPDRAWLDDRRRRGLDRKDEVWDGVLHVAPAPTTSHQMMTTDLVEVIGPLARLRGLRPMVESAILDPRDHDRNYRIPDLLVVAPQHLIERGTEGPVAIVIEVLSPNDESRDKFDFYAERGVGEIWIIDPQTRETEVYVLRGRKYFASLPDANHLVHAPALDLQLAVIAGPKLRVTWTGGSAEL